ncbi:MAG: hypothetical protein N2560_00305 [Ignavibacteria bacterium]|nr:hypothetical protein [Ignavibacteria bacterium]
MGLTLVTTVPLISLNLGLLIFFATLWETIFSKGLDFSTSRFIFFLLLGIALIFIEFCIVRVVADKLRKLRERLQTRREKREIKKKLGAIEESLMSEIKRERVEIQRLKHIRENVIQKANSLVSKLIKRGRKLLGIAYLVLSLMGCQNTFHTQDSLTIILIDRSTSMGSYPVENTVLDICDAWLNNSLPGARLVVFQIGSNLESTEKIFEVQIPIFKAPVRKNRASFNEARMKKVK